MPKIIADLTPLRIVKISIHDFLYVQLVDDRFNIPESAGMLLDAEIFCELLKIGQIRVSYSELILQDASFGFVISGRFETENYNSVYCGLIKKESNLGTTLKNLGEKENIAASETKK